MGAPIFQETPINCTSPQTLIYLKVLLETKFQINFKKLLANIFQYGSLLSNKYIFQISRNTYSYFKNNAIDLNFSVNLENTENFYDRNISLYKSLYQTR